MAYGRTFLTALTVLVTLGCARAELTVGAASASGEVTASYSWSLTKQATGSGATLTVPASGSATAHYVITVSRTTNSRQVTVTGSFTVTNSDPDNAAPASPQLTFSTATTAVSPSVTCSPPGDIPAAGSTNCQFTASWTDTSVTAGASGTVTITPAPGVPGSTAPYNFIGNGGRPAGSCATLSDAFSGGTISSAANAASITYSMPISGLQVCDDAEPSKQYAYTVTFSNLPTELCSSQAPITAVNEATLSVLGANNAPSDTKQASASLTLSLSGCQGATVTVGNLQTTVINTYRWTLEKTGGGGSLTTTPSEELAIPFTITATQTAAGTVGYVAGTVSVQNTAAIQATISAISVTISGQSAQDLPVSNCKSPTLPAMGTTSCSFNISNPSAPAAGSVTASVTLAGSTTTATSNAANFDYQSAQTFNIGGTATIYDTADTTGLQTIAGQLITGTLVRYEPADQRPPETAPGLTIDGTRTFTYNMIVTRLMTCANALTVSNVATLVPQQGSNQGSLTSSAQATFSVIGCNVLPTLSLSNLQQWAAVTWSWSMQKTATPNTYQFEPGQGGNVNYQVMLSRTRQSGNYWLSGTLQITNPASFPMYISSVGLVSTAGQFGALPTNCLGGSNIGATTTNNGLGVGGVGVGGVGVGNLGTTSGLTGSFILRAGAQIDCVFNISAGTGAPLSGNIQAMATTSTTVVGSAGNVAYSPNAPINFAQPTKQWDIGGCVMFTDTATVTGFAGSWIPQVTGLPQQQQICDEQKTYNYAGAISPVPVTGVTCNTPVTITNNAQAMPIGGGATVTATATVTAMAINCPTASPTPGPMPPPVPLPSPSPATLTPVIITVNPGIAAAAAGDYVWAVTVSNSAGGSIEVPYSESREVQFTVAADRQDPAASSTVTGQVTVANPNTSPVTVSSVTVTLAPSSAGSTTAAAVPPVTANCGSAFPITLAAGANAVCSFTALVTGIDPGVVTAAAESSVGASTTLQGVPYSFNAAANSSSSLGRCAVISDSLAGQALILTAATMTVTGNRPAGNTQVVCEDTTYVFTARFGPFPASSCNAYPVTATATVTPDSGPQAAAPAAAQSTVQLRISGCAGQIASADTVVAVVDAPTTAASNSTFVWTASQVPSAEIKLRYQQSGYVKFNVTWDRVARVTSLLAGTVTISNPTKENVTIASVNVQPELEGNASQALGAIPMTAASCQSAFLSPNQSTTCSYTTVIPVSGSGTITAEVDLGSGKSVVSAPTSFTFTEQAPAARTRRSRACADILSGLMLGSALMVPGAAGPMKSNSTRVCRAGGMMIQQPVGPFKNDQCGRYVVSSTVRVRPLSETQTPFAVNSPAALTVTGCPLSVTPSPEVSIHSSLQAYNIVTYGWNVSITSNVTRDPLAVQFDKPTAVQVTGSVKRGAGVRTAAIGGAVQLMSQGISTLTVHTVQAAALTRTGQYIIVNATCPANSTSNGAITIPPAPAKVLCTFNITDLPPMDGAVVPLVYVKRGSNTPLPAEPGVYRTAKAPRNVIGSCVQVGTSRTLTKEGSVSPLAGQPVVRQGGGLPTTPVCETSSANWMLTFGPFKPSECGSYSFSSDLSADLTNTADWERSKLEFNIEVEGCP